MHIRILEAFAIEEPTAREYLQRMRELYGRPGLTLSMAIPSRPPELQAHESLTALSLTVPELIRNAIQAERDGVDGILVDCMADPGIEILRETVSIPVLGPGHSSMHVAAMLGRRFSLLVTTDFSSRYFLAHVERAGLGTRLASREIVDVPPEEIAADSDATFRGLVAASERAIEVACADTLVLCCTGFAPFSVRLQQALSAKGWSVPLIDPMSTTINLLAALNGAGLTHSRVAYPDTGIRESISTASAGGKVVTA
jgi:allantoin racemase